MLGVSENSVRRQIPIGLDPSPVGFNTPSQSVRIPETVGSVDDRDVLRSDLAVMGRRMMLGVVVCAVSAAWCPIDDELALIDAIADPVEAHVNGT